MQISLLNVVLCFLLHFLTCFQEGVQAVSGKGEYSLKYLVSCVLTVHCLLIVLPRLDELAVYTGPGQQTPCSIHLILCRSIKCREIETQISEQNWKHDVT